MATRSNWVNQYQHMMDVALRRKLLNSLHPDNKNTHFPVVIQFKQKPTTASIRSFKQLMKSYSFTMGRKLSLINAISGKASISCLKKMCQTNMVQCVYLNRKVRKMLDIATPTVGSKDAQRAGYTGVGVGIAIIDTGIFPHPDLGNRIIGFRDFINNRQSPYDDNGHGTHVAGCAAGNGASSNGKYTGTAPKANLVGVKVLDSQGSGSFSQVIAGIQWAVANRNRYGIRVINLSLGGVAVTPYTDDPVAQAIEAAVRAGVVAVIAAGNSGPQRRTISTPGISPSAITVGAADDRDSNQQTDDTVASFSSRGPTIDGLMKPDLVAPGVNITSLRAPGSQEDRQGSNRRVGNWYFTLSGTSMATPIVSGAVAQILQQNPSLTPSQVKALIKRNAVNLGYSDDIQGSGELNVRFLAAGRSANRSNARRLTIRNRASQKSQSRKRTAAKK